MIGNDVNVMFSSSKRRSIRPAIVYGLFVKTIFPCLRQFHRCPSWLVNQRENKCLGIISVLGATAVACWENKKRKKKADRDTDPNVNSSFW